jgi:hypothetical protein
MFRPCFVGPQDAPWPVAAGVGGMEGVRADPAAGRLRGVAAPRRLLRHPLAVPGSPPAPRR